MISTEESNHLNATPTEDVISESPALEMVEDNQGGANVSPNNELMTNDVESDADSKTDDTLEASEMEEDTSEEDKDYQTTQKEPVDPTSLILQAVSLKEVGNNHFKSGNLTEASRSYRKGTSLLKNLNNQNTGDEQVKALLLSLQTNLSMVCLKQNKPKQSRDVATSALSVDR